MFLELFTLFSHYRVLNRALTCVSFQSCKRIIIYKKIKARNEPLFTVIFRRIRPRLEKSTGAVRSTFLFTRTKERRQPYYIVLYTFFQAVFCTNLIHFFLCLNTAFNSFYGPITNIYRIYLFISYACIDFVVSAFMI